MAKRTLQIKGKHSTVRQREDENQLSLDFTITSKLQRISDFKAISDQDRDVSTGEVARIDKMLRHPNLLMSAQFDFTVVERRIFFLVLREMKSIQKMSLEVDNPWNQQITFNIHYSQIIDSKPSNNFIKSVEKIQDRKIFWVDSKGVPVTTTMFFQYSYVNGFITLYLTPTLVPLFIDLSRGYTDYSLDNVMAFSSEYAQILYPELCRVISMRNEWKLSLEELREMLYVKPGTYPQFKEFKRNVLDFALTQINQLTDLEVSYEYIRQGRSVIGIHFFIRRTDKSGAAQERKRIQADIQTKVKDAYAAFAKLDEFVARHHVTNVLAESYPNFSPQQKNQIITNMDFLTAFIRADLYATHDPYIQDRTAYVAEAVFNYKKAKKRREV